MDLGKDMDKNIILEKTYAGFLGMNIGIRLGAPVEPSLWTYERINRFYGDITDYVKPFINFAADDDVNGPVYFLRALEDNIKPSTARNFTLTAKMVAQAWLNYTREGVGFFWWGGYGTSTEHTAYLNLKSGIEAPRSGSIAVNGKTLAEQIGGQIFIDTWGFINPGKPQRAALMARTAASVSHDGEGLNGAAFIASAIALAYEENEARTIIEKALEYVDKGSLYDKVVRSVMDFYDRHPDSWRACMEYLIDSWGYDKYPGVCHIIPNAGVCAMSMLYGKTFARAIEIATMAGWDTDCNAGNVGSILGTMGGISAILDKYRKPVGDFIALSGISGYLNILDVPTYVKKLYAIGAMLEGESDQRPREGIIDFDFSLSGSTHGFRSSDSGLCTIANPDDGKGLRVLYDRMTRPQKAKIFYKTFYRRSDFSDERYMPVFSPLAYSGQRVLIDLSLEKISGESMIIQAYVHDTITSKDVLIKEPCILWDSADLKLEFTIPDLKGDFIDEIGFILESNSPAKFCDLGEVRIKSFIIDGEASFTIEPEKLKMEFSSVLGYSHDHGSWSVDKDGIHVMCLEPAMAMTGNYFGRDESIQAALTLHYGDSALLGLRVQGAQRGYWAGILSGSLVIARMLDGRLQTLISEPYELEMEKPCTIAFSVKGTSLKVCYAEKTLRVVDESLDHGAVGLLCQGPARATFSGQKIIQTMN